MAGVLVEDKAEREFVAYDASISGRLACVKTAMYTRAASTCQSRCQAGKRQRRRRAPAKRTRASAARTLGWKGRLMSWVHDRIFAAGGGQVPRAWAAFADQTAIRAIVHLAPDQPDRFIGPPPSAYLWLRIGDEAEADMAARKSAGRFVETCLADGLNVLLHSSVSRHRTRWVFVSYLLVSGSTLPHALRLAAEKPWLSPYRTDESAWQTFIRTLDEARETPAEPAGLHRGDDHAFRRSGLHRA